LGGQLIITDEVLSNLPVPERFPTFSQMTLRSSSSKDTKAPAVADKVCPSINDTHRDVTMTHEKRAAVHSLKAWSSLLLLLNGSTVKD